MKKANSILFCVLLFLIPASLMATESRPTIDMKVVSKIISQQRGGITLSLRAPMTASFSVGVCWIAEKKFGLFFSKRSFEFHIIRDAEDAESRTVQSHNAEKKTLERKASSPFQEMEWTCRIVRSETRAGQTVVVDVLFSSEVLDAVEREGIQPLLLHFTIQDPSSNIPGSLNFRIKTDEILRRMKSAGREM